MLCPMQAHKKIKFVAQNDSMNSFSNMFLRTKALNKEKGCVIEPKQKLLRLKAKPLPFTTRRFFHKGR